MSAQGRCPSCKTELAVCPSCTRIVLNTAAVRQAVIDAAGIFDVGFRCPECGHEWGFEVLGDERYDLRARS